MIGVLALQGDYERHCARLARLGAKCTLVKTAEDLRKVRGLILPGGESSVLLKLCDETLKTSLKERAADRMPMLATCAGLIFLAQRVESPTQESLMLLDVDVRRNAYGRQVDSFIEPNLSWTASGKAAAQKRLGATKEIPQGGIEGVFIRAPRIIRVGPAAKVVIERNSEPVMVQQDNLLGATFHPELSESSTILHEYFISLCY